MGKHIENILLVLYDFNTIAVLFRIFLAIAVVGGKAGNEIDEFCAPCGVCRQVMMEFCNPDTFQVIMAIDEEHYQVEKLGTLFPMGFGPGNLK